MRFPDREQIEQLSTATIFKWIFLCAAGLCVPYYLLMGLLALFGWETVSWNGRPLTGFLGLIAGPFLGVFAAVILTVAIGGACIIAIRVFGALADAEGEEPEPPAEEGPAVDDRPAPPTPTRGDPVE